MIDEPVVGQHIVQFYFQICINTYPISSFCVADRGGLYHLVTGTIYKMKSSPKGIALIFHMEKFDGAWKPRDGSEEDVGILKDLFRDLDLEVQVENNLSREQLKDKLKSVTGKDHSSYDCFVMVIMSHGQSDVVVCSDGNVITVHELRDMISKCETLRGKPKLIFIVACRGILEDEGISIEAPKHADFKIVFSTVDRYVSYRASHGGSIVVSCLDRVFRKYVASKDLDGILKEFIREVSSIEVNRESKTCRQVPEVIDTFSRYLYFY